MTRRARRLPIFLLVFLLVTWGTCPCVFARMLDLERGEAEAAAGRAEPQAPC